MPIIIIVGRESQKDGAEFCIKKSFNKFEKVILFKDGKSLFPLIIFGNQHYFSLEGSEIF
jgi:hypothetical protein